ILVAVAVPRLTAPCTSLTTEVSLTVELELVSDLLATRLATVLVEELAEELTLWDEQEFLEEAIFLLAELLEDSANCEDLLAEADSASCEALEEAALVAKLFDFELLAVNPLLAQSKCLGGELLSYCLTRVATEMWGQWMIG